MPKSRSLNVANTSYIILIFAPLLTYFNAIRENKNSRENFRIYSTVFNLGLIYLSLGGNITGKANCEFMCFSGCSFSSSCGPVLNPHDTTRSAGGSSSGSAVLVS